MYIICYAGGTCGDLVTAVIDSQDTTIEQNRLWISKERTSFKKPHLLTTIQEKDLYYNTLLCRYLSLPSHDLEYHAHRGHNVIGITVKDKIVAVWAAERFKLMHRPHVWEEMTRACGATTVEEYAEILLHYGNLVQSKTQQTLQLESILAGNLISDLQKLVGTDVKLNLSLYQQWLTAQNNF